ncbi:MAG: Sua5/YciO/YrdC/YwlC family protein [Gemmataceae bacterium]|nr:Sua5/YciO/YrdC/YwlC family protein [Gemmataceae bacterium]
MPTVLDWSPAVDPSPFARQVADALAPGAVVVLPGDAGYVALVNPAAPSAAAHLDALGGLTDEPPAVLAAGPDDAARLGLDVPVAARRLMFRAWPAALAVALPADRAAFPSEWPGAVRGRLTAGGRVRFRSPDHPLFDAVLPALTAPALVVETGSGRPDPVLGRLGDAVGFAAAAGDRPADPRPTEVLTTPAGWDITREGAFGRDELEKLAARMILFVCTGNTCRSPLAEGLGKALLAERLGCRVDELPARGFWLLSAGVATSGGSPATPDSVEAGAELGADLRDHRSRPVNPQLLAAADDVIAMTRGHADALAYRFPGVGPAARLLCPEGGDVDDPIGAGPDVYRACGRAIRDHLGRFIPEWAGS